MKENPIDRHIVEAYEKRSNQGKASTPEHGNQMLTLDTMDSVTEKQRSLQRAMYNLTINNIDVAEVYSPERVTRVAEQYGLKPGWSLDLTTTDENGRPWGFQCTHVRNKAARKLLQEKPTLVIGSPMCTEFS